MGLVRVSAALPCLIMKGGWEDSVKEEARVGERKGVAARRGGANEMRVTWAGYFLAVQSF